MDFNISVITVIILNLTIIIVDCLLQTTEGSFCGSGELTFEFWTYYKMPCKFCLVNLARSNMLQQISQFIIKIKKIFPYTKLSFE